MLKNKTLNKILVPLDGSKNSLRGLKFALGIAKQSESSIIGLNVSSPPILIRNLTIVKIKTRQNSRKIIEEAKLLSQKVNIPFTGITKISNNVGRTIVIFAESHKVDMIVIGSRGPDPEIELFLGSVANYVINKSRIPVTIIK